MGKTDYENGSATLEDYAAAMNERHAIYERRKSGQPPPWSEDWIFNTYRFTNVFRELDHGTRVIRKILNAAIAGGADDGLVLFNVIAYRYFNHWDNWSALGFVDNFEAFESHMRQRNSSGFKVFTAAHLLGSRAFEKKIDTYTRGCRVAWDQKDGLAKQIKEAGTLEGAFKLLLPLEMVGPFLAFEMASDLRWTPLLSPPLDVYTWANVGPGCKRGLHRLGLPASLESLQWIYQEVKPLLNDPLKKHLPDKENLWPPFELREIEHWACEFDKYERVKTGAGRPRQKLKLHESRDLIL